VFSFRWIYCSCILIINGADVKDGRSSGHCAPGRSSVRGIAHAFTSHVNTLVLTFIPDAITLPVMRRQRRLRKLSQLQIRVTEEEKAAIRRAAERAGMDMSLYVLSRALPAPASRFQEAVRALAAADAPSFALADINSLLAKLTATELRVAIAAPPERALPPFLANYLAAMVEAACGARGIPVPRWTERIAPLDEPAFGSPLRSLRLHLLTHSPAPFRRRNIFIDSSLGARV
jgi:uncharacterized protein (DUF1778 family)